MKYTFFLVNANSDQGIGHIERCKRVIMEFDNSFSQSILVECIKKNFIFKFHNNFTDNFEVIKIPPFKSEISLIIDSYKKLNLEFFYENYITLWEAILKDNIIYKNHKIKHELNVDLNDNKKLDGNNILVSEKFFKKTVAKKGVVIMLGGSTEFYLYKKILEAIKTNPNLNKRIGVVYTGDSKSILELIKSLEVEICETKQEIPEFLNSFELGIGTGGFGWFERIAAKVGQIVIPTSENEINRANLISTRLKGFKIIKIENIKEIEDLKIFKHEKITGLDGNGPKRLSYKINLIWALEGIKQSMDLDWNKDSEFFFQKFFYLKKKSKWLNQLEKKMSKSNKDNFFDLQLKIICSYDESRVNKKSIPIYYEEKNTKSIEILIDQKSWIIYMIYSVIKKLIGNSINIFINSSHRNESDIKDKFLFGYQEIIGDEYLKNGSKWMVIHESNLPDGRGWSPITWSILENKKEIIGTLFEASKKVDDGKILCKTKINTEKITLVDDLRKKQMLLSEKLITFFLFNKDTEAIDNPKELKYYRRRTGKDSFLNLSNAQKNLIRVCDNKNYPLWTKIGGKKIVLITKELN